MGKLAKVCLVIAAIMIALGLFVGTIVTALGGGNLIRAAANNGIVNITPWGMNFWDWGWNWGRNWNISNNHWNGGFELTVNGDRVADNSYSKDFSFDNIDSLYITVGVGEFNVIPWDKNVFKIKITGVGACRYYERGSTLHVDGFDFTGWTTTNLNTRNNKMTLYVPESIYYDEINIEVGVGSLDISGLTSRRLRSDSGVGSLNMNGMSTERLTMTNGIGEAKFRGVVNGDVSVDTGIGSVRLQIEGNENDFNYDISCSIGSVVVGKQSYSGLANDRRINNNADKNMRLNCAIGEITVTFY